MVSLVEALTLATGLYINTELEAGADAETALTGLNY
jgi:hypothetical protein